MATAQSPKKTRPQHLADRTAMGEANIAGVDY
jgi:hypothetical protein